jgi:Mg2+/Co2+ transporter CorB
MTFDLWLTLGAILALLCTSAFFSGSETALTAVSRARMMQLGKQGDKSAERVNTLTHSRERLIGALLLGNNLVNILASALATSAFLRLFGEAGVAFATLIMTALVLIFAEVMPKTVAIARTDAFARMVSLPVSIIVAIFGPVTATVQIIVRFVLRLMGVNVDADSEVLSAREEIRGQLDLLHAEGSVIKVDRDRLGGVLDLHDLEVVDVMIHRTNMQTINADEDADVIIREVLQSPYTRIPLWRDTPDNIIAVLHAKDLLRSLYQPRKTQKLDILSIAQKPWFIPDTTELQVQLNAFLKKKSHFALVVDEYGEVQGLITLEDILEEIVGDIADEHDVVMEGVRPGPDGSVIVDGSVSIRDLNRAMDWALPDEEATTIAGLVIHEARQIPDSGQAFTFHGFRFQVLKRVRNRLESLRVSPVKEDETLETEVT